MGEPPIPTDSEIGAPWAGSPVSVAAATSGITDRYFTLQDQRPEGVGEIELIGMEPGLRTLLFTDGTVTRTLEAQTLSPVSVSVISQATVPTSDSLARLLEAPPRGQSVRRRVTISIDPSPTPAIWAESHIVPERLPSSFLDLLEHTPDGIGESLQQIRLESWRELLWFGLDSPPPWESPAGYDALDFLTRLYRVITRGRPALLISESFAVERRAGVYHLAGA